MTHSDPEMIEWTAFEMTPIFESCSCVFFSHSDQGTKASHSTKDSTDSLEFRGNAIGTTETTSQTHIFFCREAGQSGGWERGGE